ncbi:MAG: response regulator [Chitinispirillales bacterium]|jgi:signal transduction histidine kinase/CheY-like chemotaxis protein|nr:response regulator [Chitinispirillales bacterium]
MKKIKGSVLLFTVILSTVFWGCADEGGKQSHKTPAFTSYKDVPGVTEDEINAIEALKKQADAFIYASTLGTEAFITEDGRISGYIALFCDWLSALFGIRFVPEVHDLSDLYDKLNSGEIDFAGITAADEYHDTYFFSDPIAKRSVKVMRIAGSHSPEVIALYRLPRYIFVEGSITYSDVSALLEPGSFHAVFAGDYDAIYRMLKNGEADAFIAMGTAEGAFDSYGHMVSEDFSPLIFNSVTMTAKNPAFEPLISVVTKALRNGGIHYLTHLYTIGHREYLANILWKRFNEEEREYIRNNPVVMMGAQHYNYPIDFYNTHEGQWQGIAFDILREVSLLTGLSFEVAVGIDTEWLELLRLLEAGKISFVPQLNRTPATERRFLWPEFRVRDSYLLISKSDFPLLRVNDILSLRVGLIKDYSSSAMFYGWFPDHPYTTEYGCFDSATVALERGDVDVMMGSMLLLLAMTNYQERSGFKANLVLASAYGVSPGFNRNEAVLLSILEKAFALIDVNRISNYWISKTFDYQAKVLQAQRPWLFGAIGLSLIVIILVSAFFVRSRNIGKKLEKLVMFRTEELQIRTEEALAASHSKSTFLATMSHEIRTPMNSIMGFAELAVDSGSMQQMRGYLEKITNSTKWLLRIINDILDISKIESGKMELEKIPFDLNDVISRCQSVTLPDIKEKGLDFEVYAELPEGKKVLSDPVRLYQALINLLSNAVKFTSAGTVKLSLQVKNSDDSNATVYFEVKDSGIGMNPAQIGKIFDPFTQADSSTTRNYGGTGLGLAITKNIVELMGGKLTAESAPDAGSTFSFEITFKTADANGGANVDMDYNLIEKPCFNGLVLVCDDNLMNQQVAREHLTRVGLEAMVADNGKAGVEMVEERTRKGEKPFDLILMDIFMPVMDGIEAASKITALNTGTPIVALTANVMVSELDNYRKNGMPDYLGKPFTSQELWRVLLKYLTPVSSTVIDGDEQARDGDELLEMLRFHFVRNNQTKFADIVEAIEAGDIKLAHRLSHTLKGNAGQIGEKGLQSAALGVETLLKSGAASVPEDKMNLLKTELARVLEELRPLLDESAAQAGKTLTMEQAAALFEETKIMLENINPAVVNLLDDIRAVPGTEELVRQIEDYDFESAAKTLADLTP